MFNKHDPQFHPEGFRDQVSALITSQAKTTSENVLIIYSILM
jgi:hypothetical protein